MFGGEPQSKPIPVDRRLERDNHEQPQPELAADIRLSSFTWFWVDGVSFAKGEATFRPVGFSDFHVFEVPKGSPFVSGPLGSQVCKNSTSV